MEFFATQIQFTHTKPKTEKGVKVFSLLHLGYK